MATWENYRQWIDSRLAALTPEQLAAVQGLMAHSMMDADRSQFDSAWQSARVALESAGYSTDQASDLLSIAYNVRKHPEADTQDLFALDRGAIPVDTQNAMLSLQALPGQKLDTTKSDEDKRRTDDFIKALQQEAATGGGAWEQALKEGKEAATSQAVSLAESQPGMSAGASLRAMGAGRSAAEMQASAAENKLRTEQKQKAAEQLAGVLGGTQTIEAAQAEMGAAAKQAGAEAQTMIQNKKTKEALGFAGGAGQAITSAATMSDGGKVPGKPKVFGDDEANDTVPAMLSPGEIVIPRSIATAPDADRKAADFVAHVKAKHGMQHFDDGGQVAPGGESFGSDLFFKRQPFSTQTGAVLETGPYSQARAAALKNLDENLMPMALGKGPSVVPWEIKSNIDESNAAAMQAMARGHAPGDLSKRVGVSGGKMAAGEAGRAMQEQAHEMDIAAKAALEQRSRDLQFANAQREAAWRNTMMNMGIDLQNQAALRGLLSGAGQGLTALGTQLAKPEAAPGSETSEWAQYQPSYSAPPMAEAGAQSGMESPSNIGGKDMAHGGMVENHRRLRSFLAAMGAE